MSLIVLFLLFAGAGTTGHALESSPMALPGRASVALPVQLDHAQLLADVKQLSAPEFEGRKTGSPGNLKAQQLIAQRFLQIGLTPFKAGYLQPFSFIHQSGQRAPAPNQPPETSYPSAANVLGIIAGTKNPEKILVISAHYDHLGIHQGKLHPGADDNASGVGTLLALAAWFKAHPPGHSIVFAAFDAEELGHEGAKAFMAELPFPRAQLVMNLNLDMLGHNDQNQIYVAGLYHYPQLRPYVDLAVASSTVQVLSGHDRPAGQSGMLEDWTHSSDHAAFHKAGIPFLYFGVEDHPDYHAPTDTFERLNQAFLVQVAELVLQTALALDAQLGAIKPK